MKTLTFLCEPRPGIAHIHSRVKSMEDRELLQAIHNPDHSPAAISVIREILHTRGRTDEEIDRFRIDPDELCMPSFAPTPTPSGALARVQRWRKVNRMLNVLILAAAALSLPSCSEKHISLFTIACWCLAAALYLLKPILWRYPVRILLLRPFGTERVSMSLTRFVRTNLNYFGHVFTLADKHVKESPFIVRVMSVAPISIESIILLPYYPFIKRLRPRIFVRNASDFRALSDRLWSRWILNTFWRGSYLDKLRAVQTTESWWRRCIDLLASTCEAIVVDLTIVKAGTRWEVSKICAENLLPKTLFIVQNTFLPQAQQILTDCHESDITIPIFTYDAGGHLEQETAFRDAVCQCLSLPRPTFAGKARLSRLAVWALILSVAAWILLAPTFLLKGPKPVTVFLEFIFWHAAFVSPLLAFSALSKMSYASGRLRGRCMAIFGGIIGVVPFVIALASYVGTFATPVGHKERVQKELKAFPKLGDGKLEPYQARKQYEDALKTYREAAQKDPDSYLPDVALALNYLGTLNREQNRREEAMKQFEEALKIYREAAQRDAEAYQPYVALALNNLGTLNSEQNRTEEASAQYEEALEIYREAAQRDADAYQPCVALVLNNLGILENNQNRIEQAREEVAEALRIYEALAKQNPQRFSADVKRVKELLAEFPSKQGE
jgi:tetratricopeptide (TPR) repeat protein